MRTPGWSALVPLAGLLAMSVMTAGAQERPAKGPESTSPEASRSLSLTVGKTLLIDCAAPIDRVSVGLGGFVEVTAVSPREVLLNGKAPGETSLIIWQEGGNKLLFDVRVGPNRFLARNRIDLIDRQIRTELPGQNITVSFDDDTVFLRGKVKDVTSADRAVSIASTLGKTVNLLYVDVPPAEEQILLKVKFASVDRNLSKQLGMNLFSTGALNTTGSATTQQFVAPVISSARAATATLSDALNLFLFRPDLNLGATIKVLETKGLLQVLAEPNVLAQNGKQASFLAGGEFPFPVVQGSTGGGAAAVTIQFREFGIRLNFVPIVTPRGSISLRVAPEVSALDFTHGLSVNGFAVPALTVRKLNTAVELSQGQSFAIGGLLDNRVTDTFQKMPFIGDLPVIGKFFQSRSRNTEKTELLVIVTPELVRPISPGEPAPHLDLPAPFLEPSTGQSPLSPGSGATPSVVARPPGEAIPIETLVRTLQKDAPPEPSPQLLAMPQVQPPAAPSVPPLR